MKDWIHVKSDVSPTTAQKWELSVFPETTCPWLLQLGTLVSVLCSFLFIAVLDISLSWVSLCPDNSAHKGYGLVFFILTPIREQCCSRFGFVLFPQKSLAPPNPRLTSTEQTLKSESHSYLFWRLLSHVSDAFWTLGDYTDSGLNNIALPSTWNFLLHSLPIMSYSQFHMLKNSLLDSFLSFAAQN